MSKLTELYFSINQSLADLSKNERNVLSAASRLKNTATGITIRREVNETTGKNLSIRTVYRCINSLKKKGFVTKKIGEWTKEGGGLKREFVDITESGLKKISDLWDLDQIDKEMSVESAFRYFGKTLKRYNVN